MRTCRLRRPALGRLSPIILFSAAAISCTTTAAAADRELTGVVVDQTGRPLPRAYVQAFDGSVLQAAAFTDEAGRFRLRAAPGSCRVEASLTGFETSSTACDPAPLRLVLAVAPVHETVVVSATRTEAPADQVGATVSAFNAADLERRQVPLVADLLRLAPGVMVVRSGAPGALTSLFVRGGESNYNKVLLDGIPLNEPGGTFNFGSLSSDNLERLEIVRGAHSALFGSDAMASVVQLVTRRPDRSRSHPEARFTLEGGSFGTLSAGAAASGTARALDYAVSAHRISTDNQVPNNAFDNTTLSANVGVAAGSTAVIRLLARSERAHAGTPGQTAFGRPDFDAFFDRQDAVGGLSFDQQIRGRFRQRAAYSVAASSQQSTNVVADPPYVPRFGTRAALFSFSDFLFDSRTKLRRHHASYQIDWRPGAGVRHGNHLLTALADWDGERARLENRVSPGVTRASRNNVGWSLQHQAMWRRVFTTAGGRIEHNDSFGTAFVPRGSVVFVARSARGTVGDTRLRASAGLGIKEPTVLESFSLSPFFRGNPGLKPERARTVEAGIEQRLAGDRVKIDVVGFFNRFRDRISTRTIDPATFETQYFNIGQSRARGAELSLDAAPAAPLHLRAGYTFLASKVIESTAPNNVVLQAGNWMFRRPRHSGFVDAAWEWRRLNAGVNGAFVGRFVDSDFSSLQPPLVQNDGYTVWDARLGWKVTSRVTGTLSIDNVGDASYMEALGYPALRRAIRGGFRVGL